MFGRPDSASSTSFKETQFPRIFALRSDRPVSLMLPSDADIPQSPVRNIRKPGRRMFRTGDCGMSASDGSMRLTGRSDRRAKIRGNWVSLNEVELALSGLPNIEKAVVVDEMSTSGEVRLAAYVVLDGHSASLQTIRSALREKLSLLAVPGKFVELSTMPLTASGKVDRQLLR